MVWLLVGAVIWVAVAVPAAVLIGRAIRLADERRTAAGARPPGPVPRPRAPGGERVRDDHRQPTAREPRVP